MSQAESSPPRSPRRTEGVRVQGRSARVVEEVLEAVAEELGRVGYAALRIEDVAACSGVNKTTIYRRWPTKSELVLAALKKLTAVPDVPDTGELRSDLFALLERMRARVSTDAGRGLVRLLQTERAHPEFAEVVRQIRREHNEVRKQVFDRAVQRGELPADTDTRFLVEVALAPVVSRLFHLELEADDAFLARVVAMVIAGAKAGAARA